LRALQRAMPSNAIVSTDIGNTCSVANGYLKFDTPGSFLAAMTFGNCGYAFPTAIGAKVGCPDRPVVAYVGDGAWGMSLGEVLTCVRENIPTTAVVFNNGQWGAEKKNQVLWFGDRYVGSQLKNPSFAEVARSMGAEGIQVFEESEVEGALKKAIDMQMNEGKTCIVELMTSRELGDPFRRDAMKLPVRVLDKYASTTRTEESATQQPTDL
jgi:sulfoacetaldehyde acetyltransferase